MKFLMLRLEGPIQSWGEQSFWDERDTGKCPSKSGVVGLMSLCLGLKREDEKISYIYDNCSVSVRIDDPGYIMRDYQIIQNTATYDNKLNKNMVVSPRYYITNASFLVAVGFYDESLLEDIKTAVNNPLWTPYLGRKCCIPSIPLLCGVVENENAEQALINNKFEVRCFGNTGNYIEMNIEDHEKNQKEDCYERTDVYGLARFPKNRIVYDKYVSKDKFNLVNIIDEVK